MVNVTETSNYTWDTPSSEHTQQETIFIDIHFYQSIFVSVPLVFTLEGFKLIQVYGTFIYRRCVPYSSSLT